MRVADPTPVVPASAWPSPLELGAEPATELLPPRGQIRIGLDQRSDPLGVVIGRNKPGDNSRIRHGSAVSTTAAARLQPIGAGRVVRCHRRLTFQKEGRARALPAPSAPAAEGPPA